MQALKDWPNMHTAYASDPYQAVSSHSVTEGLVIIFSALPGCTALPEPAKQL